MPPRLNIPPVTRTILLVLTVQSLLNAAIRYRQWTSNSNIVIPYLVFVPQLSIVYPWTLLTTTFVENNVFTLAISAATIFHGGRYLERAWSSAELAKFVAIVSVIPTVLSFATLVTFFTLTGNEGWTLTVIAGTVSLQISLLVAFSQLVPAHTVTLFRGILSLRVPRFPILYICAVAVLAMTPLMTSASFFLATYGFLTSWTYLRFYKRVFPDLDSSQPTSLRGDASETFALAEFFPGPVKPVVASLSTAVFDVLVSLRICTPFSQAEISAARGDNNFIQRTAPGGARAEAERRRALALKALDQRLQAAASNSAARSQPTSSTPPPPREPTGPTVQTQPGASTQTAMTTQPTAMLGETNYTPDNEGMDKGSA
ncbi:related to human PL6 protein [Cephalotrichum gorgonifer]|uniref:Related to human PL6 protein n=1 Tax=Cephalotrichum gorgonifer TaxID=2041049 RepID=A0AAE8SWA2_9PEZI|nr:related to human PL6 protein [Cephalotrichum gorgonifer]